MRNVEKPMSAWIPKTVFFFCGILNIIGIKSVIKISEAEVCFDSTLYLPSSKIYDMQIKLINLIWKICGDF